MAPRILCVSPQFVPLGDPSAFVGAKLVSALRDAGADVTVLCDPDTFLRHGGSEDASPFWEKFRDVTVPLHVPERDNPLALGWLGVRYFCWRTYPRWIHSAVTRARELHREKPFDVVYSRSLPAAAHIAGYWCSKALGLPWIAHDDDPWDDQFFPNTTVKAPWMADRVSRFWLAKTVEHADAMTFPSWRLGEYTTGLVQSGRAFDVIPHVGWASEPAAPSQGFRMLYNGTLGRHRLLGDRSAGGVLEGLARFLKARPDAKPMMKLSFFGRPDGETQSRVKELELSDVVEFPARISYEQSLKDIASATACLLIEPDTPVEVLLLSKLVDYVAARKPVLSISPAVGTMADLMPEPGLTLCRARDVEGIARAIAGLYDDHRAGRLDARRPSEKLVREFSSEAIAGKFLSVCKRIIKHA